MTDGMKVIVCYRKCWACMFGEHHDPPRPHTWDDDGETQDPATAGNCGCYCAQEPEPVAP